MAAQATDFIVGFRLAGLLPGGVFNEFLPATCLISAWRRSHDRPRKGVDVVAIGMAPRLEMVDHCLPDLAGLECSLISVAPPGLLTVLLAAVDDGLLIIVDDMVPGFVEETVEGILRTES